MARTPKKTKKDPVSRRELIVNAALSCFMEKGVNNTRLREVAEFAKIDQPLVNYYFPTMNALYSEVFLAVLNHVNDFMLAQMERKSSSSPLKLLLNYCESYVDWVAKYPGHSSVFLYFYYLTTVEASFLEMNRNIRVTGRDRISRWLYEGIEAREFKLPPGMKVSEVAWSLQAMISGVCLQAKTEPEPDWDFVKERLLSGVESTLKF